MHANGPRNARHFRRALWSLGRVNESDYTSLISSLNTALDVLERNRTPDPAFIAAYDTLKQSRAMIIKALERQQDAGTVERAGLAAA